MDRTICDAVNQRTAAYNASLLSGNMSEYKASCYALRRAVKAAKLWYREIIESHFQLNDSRRMWQGLRTICSFENKSSAEVRADPLLADELNTFYDRFECNAVRLCDQCIRKQQTEQRWACYHRDGGLVSEGTKESEHQESSRTWWDYWPCSCRGPAPISLLACLHSSLMSPFLPLWFHLFLYLYLLSLQYTVLHILFFIFYSLPISMYILLCWCYM